LFGNRKSYNTLKKSQLLICDTVPELLDLIWRKIGFLPYVDDNLSSVSQNVLKFYQQLTGEEKRIPFIFDDFRFCR
jgi:hypothetical protein